MTRLDKTDHGFGVEMNVRIDEHEIFRLSFLIKSRDGHITRAMDKRFVLGSIKHHHNSVSYAYTLETQKGFGISLETKTTVARCTDE